MSSADSWNGMYKLGGVLLVASGALYFANLALVISQGGALPTSGAQLLAFVAQRILLIQVSNVVFFVIDAMLALGFAALFLALKENRRVYATIGGILAVVGITIDLINTLFFYSLIGLSQSYMTSSSDAAKASYAAIAEFAGGFSTGIGGSLFFTLFSMAILATNVAMLSMRSLRAPAYLGLVAGVLGIIAGITGFVPLIILWPAWFVVVGLKLFRLG